MEFVHKKFQNSDINEDQITEEFMPKFDVAELEHLIWAVAAGDESALNELYERTHSLIYRKARSVLKESRENWSERNEQDAYDVTQVTCICIWVAAGTYRFQGTPIAWLEKIAGNCARIWLRKSPGGKEVPLQDSDAIPGSDLANAVVVRVAAQQAMSALTDREQEIFRLYIDIGLTHREIAQLMNIPLSTALTTSLRARKKMQAQLA